jgi:PBSX family phage terminase large subunit
MREAIVDNPGKRATFLISRRTGKSHVLCLCATELCVRKPNAVVKYVCPKQKMVKTIVNPIMRIITEDCPIDLKPEWKEADKKYVFPNGSEIQFAGSDNGNIENLRGGFADLCLVDEAGFVDDLNYAVYSVLSPTTKTTGGKIVLASTPSREPDHDFMVDFVKQAEAEGELIKYTIYDNPMFTEEIIKETVAEYPSGVDDPQFRREYLCESAMDSQVMIVPEFDAVMRDIVRESPLPSHYDFYVSGDPATVDLTHILFGHYDFMRGVLHIDDELVLDGNQINITTQDIADGIVRKEKLLYTTALTGEVKIPHLRVMDNSHKILINDLFKEHGLEFIPTAKDNKEAQINKLRMMVRQGKVEIDPRCQNLIYQLKLGKWNKSRTGFDRIKASSDKKFKANHCDGIDALIYMVRNVDFSRNPYPDNYIYTNSENVFIPQENKNTQAHDFMRGLVNRRKKNG